MNKKGLKLLIATLAIVIGTKQVHASSVSISPSQSSITKGNIVKITVRVNSDGGIYTIGGSASCSGAGASGGGGGRSTGPRSGDGLRCSS